MHSQPTRVDHRIRLKDFATEYDAGRDKKKTKAKTDGLCRRIAELHKLLHANARHALLLVFEGTDCSGKDGAIRNVLRHANVDYLQTAYFKEPTEEEKAHDYLWRAHRAVPRRGWIGAFNRSHYEAVLVETVMLGVSKKIRQRRYREIVDFERMLVDNGVVTLKFFLHLGRREQADRLRERLSNPKKKWKFQRNDLAMRRHWDEFQDAFEAMLNATSHRGARWYVVPADHKWFRDFVIADAVVRALERLRMSWPSPKEDLRGIKIE